MVTDYLWITFTTLYHCVSTYLIWKPMSVVQLGKTEVNHQSFEISEMLTLGLGKQSCVTLKMWWSWHGETNKQWKWSQHAMRTTWKKLRYGREATKKKLQSKNQHALWNTIMQWMELTNWIKTLGTTLLSGSHTSGQRNLSHICFRSVCSMLLSFTKQKKQQGNCKTLLSFIQSVIKSWTSQEQAGGGEERVDPPTESTPRAPYNTDPRTRVNDLFAVHALVPIASTSKKPTRRCRVCARNGLRSETSFYCKSCGVPLHSGNCYTVYHSKIKYSS